MQFDHLKRRELISLLGSVAGWPFAARTQKAGRTYRLGVLALSTAAASIMILVSGGIAASQAQQPSTMLSPAALKEIAEVEAEIDRIEAQALERLAAPPDNQVQQQVRGREKPRLSEASLRCGRRCPSVHEYYFATPVTSLQRASE